MLVEDVHRLAFSASFLVRSLPGYKVCSAACAGSYRADPEGRRALEVPFNSSIRIPGFFSQRNHNWTA